MIPCRLSYGGYGGASWLTYDWFFHKEAFVFLFGFSLILLKQKLKPLHVQVKFADTNSNSLRDLMVVGASLVCL